MKIFNRKSLRSVFLLIGLLSLCSCYSSKYKGASLQAAHLSEQPVALYVKRFDFSRQGDSNANNFNRSSYFADFSANKLNGLLQTEYPKVFKSLAAGAVPVEVKLKFEDKTEAHGSMFAYFLTLGFLPGGWENTIKFNIEVKLPDARIAQGSSIVETKGLMLVSVFSPFALIQLSGVDESKELGFASWDRSSELKKNAKARAYFEALLVRAVTEAIAELDPKEIERVYYETL